MFIIPALRTARASTLETVRAAPSPLSRKARSLDHDEHSFDRDARPVTRRPKLLSVPGGGHAQPSRAGHGYVGSHLMHCRAPAHTTAQPLVSLASGTSPRCLLFRPCVPHPSNSLVSGDYHGLRVMPREGLPDCVARVHERPVRDWCSLVVFREGLVCVCD